MKHARASRPRDVAMDVLFAMGARRGDIGGRHRAALAGDELTPASKLTDRQAVSAEPIHQAAS
jgi:hypothetical protein